MKFSLENRHALNTVNVNDVKFVKLDAAVIPPNTVIVYYPTESGELVDQVTFLVVLSNVMNDVNKPDVSGVALSLF